MENMTYEETVKELNRLAKKLYETEFIIDPNSELREAIKYKMLRTGEDLMQYIDNASLFSLIGVLKRNSEGRIIGHYYKSIVYRNSNYKKVYEIKFRLN